MKLTHLILIALLTFGLTACKGSNDQAPPPPAPGHGEPAHGEPGHDHGQAEEMSGSVLETMNTAGYTYIKVKTETEEIWAAAPEFPVKVGDKVMIPQGMAMTNYHSNTLNRDFDVVYFVSNVLVAGQDAPLNPGDAMGDAAAAMGHQKPMTAPMDMDFSALTKPENGHTIAEIYAQKDALATKEVILRAKVVKFSPKIMKTNWIHLQDGSGEAGSNDLTITTGSEAAVGDTVLVKGILDLNQDFGYGYQYDLIIQDAKVTIE
nr:hypothetical protein [uncultured Desulfuromonas sp.]